MKPVSVPWLCVLAVAAAACGGTLAQFYASRGEAVPVSGWVTGILVFAMAAAVLTWGLPLRRYMRESEERALHPTMAPRKHSLDMTTAFRVVTLARAAMYSGSLVAGIFGGFLAYFLLSGTGTLVGALLPTAFASISGVVLAVAGGVVEAWGKLPPDDPEASRREQGQTPA